MRRPCGPSTTIARAYDNFFAKNDNLKSWVPVRASYDVPAMCLRATGLRFFQICHCAELNKIVEATMPLTPYDDRKVSLRRPDGNGDLDVVWASYTRRKANVTEAQQIFIIHSSGNLFVQCLLTICAIMVEGIMRNFSVK